VAAFAAVSAVALGLVAFNGVASGPVQTEQYSELSLLGADGTMLSLPRTAEPDQTLSFRIQVTSHLDESREMRLTISPTAGSASGEEFIASSLGSLTGARSATFELAPGDQWSRTITLSLPNAGLQHVYVTLDDGLETKTVWATVTVSSGSE